MQKRTILPNQDDINSAYQSHFQERQIYLTKKIYPALFGNFLEIFEFSLYGIFAKKFADVFFNNVHYGMLYSFGIFSSGFLARPIGAIVLGHIGDRYGRRLALIFSICLMSLATFGIGTLPLPEQIGIAAPFLLLVLRILQGISCGGEYTGITIYLHECLPQKPGLAGALAAISGMTGTLVALAISYVATLHFSSNWSWRVPFLSSLFLGLFIIYLRINFKESNLFEKIQIEKKIAKYPLYNVFKYYSLEFTATLCVGACNGILTFTLIAYINIFLSNYNTIGFNHILVLNFFSVLFFIVSGLSFGLVKDRLNLPTIFCLSLIAIIVFLSSTFIYKGLLNENYIFIFLSECILGILAGCFSACCNVFMCQLFPPNVRYSGIALGYSLGVSLLGGTVPTFCHLLIEITKKLYMPALYVSLGAIVGILGCMLGYKALKLRNI